MRSFIFRTLLAGMIFPLMASSEQILPRELQYLPVLIEIPLADKINSSFGTGIFLWESNKLFLVTASHCIFDASSTNRSQLINSNAVIASLLPKKDSKDKESFALDLKQLSDDE